MAGNGWGTKTSVADLLFAEPYRFDFHQALRLLRRLAPDAPGVGEGRGPATEVVRLAQALDLGFGASDLDSLTPGRDGGPPTLRVRFFGLWGAQGSLPRAFAELVAERARVGDTAARDFLDLFHHRLLALVARVRQDRRIGAADRSPEGHALAGILAALAGIDLARGDRRIPPRALLRYAGTLARRPRPLAGLTALLSDYFRVPVEGSAPRGAWLRLDDDQRTELGVLGRNNRLGREVVLGRRVWDQQAGLELRIGPLDGAAFVDLLPGRPGFSALCELVRAYLGDTHRLTVRLRVRASDLGRPRLSARGGPRLGYTTWLIGAAATPTSHELRLGPRQTGGRP